MLYQRCSFSASVGALLNNISAVSKSKDGGPGVLWSLLRCRGCALRGLEREFALTCQTGPGSCRSAFRNIHCRLTSQAHCAPHCRDPETRFLFPWGKCPRAQLLDLVEVLCSSHLEGPSMQELTSCSMGRRRTSAQAEGALHPLASGILGVLFSDPFCHCVSFDESI